jgi:carbamoylphosphate synthase large subunit
MKYLRVRSRHPSHNQLRRVIFLPTKCLLRLGSTTKLRTKYDIEFNSIDGIIKSSNKLLMKKEFLKVTNKTPKTYIYNGNFVDISDDEVKEPKFPIVAKKKYGSRGIGMYKANNEEEFKELLNRIDSRKYIFEEYTTFTREYRFHVSQLGIFHSVRKMLKSEADSRWYRNSDNCVFYLEDNENYGEIKCIEKLEKTMVDIINEMGLNIVAFDVRVNKKGDDFKIIEVNSAPSLSHDNSIVAQKYKEHIKKLYNHLKNK